tara:strand:- start:559 stop:1044 length:486 start_codon:yes stop_codon:yes gene_type:complete
MNIIYIQIGSNIGDRKSNIQKSMLQIETKLGKICRSSKIYESSPWGYTKQKDFLNSVIKVESDFSPFKTLEILQEIENNLGRVRKKKWDERIIDLDILFFNKQIINAVNLTIPHQYIQERNFVLVPLNEIAPSYKHPRYKKSISCLLNECKDLEKVYEYTI